MSVHPCCQFASRSAACSTRRQRTTQAGPLSSSFLSRLRELARWLAPAAVLALLPKCPLCLAAYVAPRNRRQPLAASRDSGANVASDPVQRVPAAYRNPITAANDRPTRSALGRAQ